MLVVVTKRPDKQANRGEDRSMATAVPQLNATIHFLHIAKTAGSALRELAQQVNARRALPGFAYMDTKRHSQISVSPITC